MNITFTVSNSSSCTKYVDLSTLPATHVEKGSKAAGIFMMLFALIFGGVPTGMLLSAIASGEFNPGMLGILIFSVIGVALFLGGLHLMFSSVTTVIDQHKITVTKKSLFGTKQWSEVLSAFEGVLSRSEYHSGGKNRPSYTLYIVELRHKEPRKVIKLYESKENFAVRTVWEDYCRKLNMPALEADGARFLKRDVEDLDKSVKELVRDGKVKVDFDPSKPPPSELSLRIDGGVLELTVLKKPSPVGFAFALLIAGAFAYIGFFVKDCPVVFGVIGVIILVLVVGGYVWSFFAKGQIRIGKDEVRTRQLTPWGVTERAGVECKDIETVRIGKQDGRGLDGVLLETDKGCIKVGEGLSAESLEWLKNCIIRVIST